MSSLPSTFKRLRGHTLTVNFRAAVAIESSEMLHPTKGEVLVKNKYVGINAADVNVVKGRYFGTGTPPVDTGFEGIGEIVELGEGVENLKIGQKVAYITLRCTSHAEYTCVEAAKLFVVPAATPEYLALLVSGLTASIGLEKLAVIKAGETILINCAAGGCGHIAVQWAKNTGCHVIGTCSTEEKVKFLKDLGCDRIINYKKENLAEILSKEYENGVNIAWETIGGRIFEAAFTSLSNFGRVILVGGISGYKNEEQKGVLPKTDLPYFPEELAFKNAAIKGFLLTHYEDCYAHYYKVLSEMVENRKLTIGIDNGEKTTGKEFFGIEGIIRGVEHLHAGKNIGKVIARLY